MAENKSEPTEEKPTPDTESSTSKPKPDMPTDETTGDGRSFVERLSHLSIDIAGGMASGAVKIAAKTGEASWKLGKSLLSPERLQMMQETGLYLRDLREVTGLTLTELSEAMDLEDKSLLEAVEQGTATLSFELILRMAALLARHDPLPFVMRMTRTYNPTIWRILNDWGVGSVTLHVERERQFINLYRRHDAARKLSDEGFAHVLNFTKSAFDMALHYTIQQEGLEDKILDVDDPAVTKRKTKTNPQKKSQ